MLIPLLTTKGKTKNCLKKYKLDDNINGTYSNNGIMKIALEQIYKQTKGKKSILLLDQYPSHRSDFIKNEAKQKKYRTDLRDITKTATSLDDVTWPTKP